MLTGLNRMTGLCDFFRMKGAKALADNFKYLVQRKVMSASWHTPIKLDAQLALHSGQQVLGSHKSCARLV